jgi:hypothetical protein
MLLKIKDLGKKEGMVSAALGNVKPVQDLPSKVIGKNTVRLKRAQMKRRAFS